MPNRRVSDTENIEFTRKMPWSAKATLIGAAVTAAGILWGVYQAKAATSKQLGAIQADVDTLKQEVKMILEIHLRGLNQQIAANERGVAETKEEVKQTKRAVKNNHKTIEEARGAISTVLSQVEKKTPE